MEVEALLLEFLQARLRSRAVKVRTYTHVQKVCFRHTGWQQIGLPATLPAQPAERIHENGRGQPRRRPLPGFTGYLLRTSFIDSPRSGVRADEVVLKNRLSAVR
jgi:hypothetical protein